MGADAVEVVRCGGDGESESEDKTAGSRFEIRGLGDGSETQRFQPRTQRTDPSSVCEGSRSGWMCMALGNLRGDLRIGGWISLGSSE